MTKPAHLEPEACKRPAGDRHPPRPAQGSFSIAILFAGLHAERFPDAETDPSDTTEAGAACRGGARGRLWIQRAGRHVHLHACVSDGIPRCRSPGLRRGLLWEGSYKPLIEALSVSGGIPRQAPVLRQRTPVGNTHPRDRSGNARGSCVSRLSPHGSDQGHPARLTGFGSGTDDRSDKGHGDGQIL